MSHLLLNLPNKLVKPLIKCWHEMWINVVVIKIIINQFKQFHCRCNLLSSSPKNDILLKMYSTSGHPRCSRVCFFIGTDLDTFCITSLAHQWILCSEWVPSEWESKQLIKTFHKSLIDGLRSIIMNYCDVFISCLDSHSDGTHSLQRNHW